MCSVVQLRFSNPAPEPYCNHLSADKLAGRRPLNLRLPHRRFASLSQRTNNASSSEPSTSSQFTAAVGSSSPSLQPSQWNLNQHHILTLNFIACAVLPLPVVHNFVIFYLLWSFMLFWNLERMNRWKCYIYSVLFIFFHFQSLFLSFNFQIELLNLSNVYKNC